MINKKLMVEAINKGTVIDHIPAGQGVKILKRLQILNGTEQITVGFNLPSNQQGHKDIIKVANRMFTASESDQLILFAPEATINVIENYHVEKKLKVSLPPVLKSVFDCPNSNCITHNEPVNSFFHLRERNSDIELRCHYCEKCFSKEIMVGL